MNAAGSSGAAAARIALLAQSSIIVFVAIALLLIVLIIVYLVYRVRRSDLQSTLIINDPVRLAPGPQPLRFEAAKIPPTINGQEFAYSFWLYLGDYAPSAEHKLILFRGGTSGGASVAGANPVVFMDSGTNRMYIALRTNASQANITDLSSLKERLSSYLVATIDYVPLQRWVCITFVQTDSLLTVYLDGDMYTIASINDMGAAGPDAKGRLPLNTRPIVAGTSGDVVVGSVAGTQSVQGYIGRLRFFNYGLTKDDVDSVYAQGPGSSSILTRLGLPAYGVRSPIYKLDP